MSYEYLEDPDWECNTCKECFPLSQVTQTPKDKDCFIHLICNTCKEL